MSSIISLINRVMNKIPSYQVEEGMIISFEGLHSDKEYIVLETDEHGKYNVLVLCEIGNDANSRFVRSLLDDDTVILRD